MRNAAPAPIKMKMSGVENKSQEEHIQHLLEERGN